MHQDGTTFILNLSIADICMGIFHLPMVIVSSCSGQWVFGQLGLRTIIFFIKAKCRKSARKHFV